MRPKACPMSCGPNLVMTKTDNIIFVFESNLAGRHGKGCPENCDLPPLWRKILELLKKLREIKNGQEGKGSGVEPISARNADD